MKKIINLLPRERKRLLIMDKLNRFIFKIGLILILAVLVFVSFLGALFFILNFYQKINIIEYSRSNTGEVEDLSREVKNLVEKQEIKTKDFIEKIDSRSPYWDYLNEINNLLPKGVYYSKIELEKSNIKIKGLSLSRDSLIELKGLLEENEEFKKVEMPISNLTSPENISFEISIELSKK